MDDSEESALLVRDERKKKINPVRGGVTVSVILGLYTTAAMAAIPLQSQYVHERVLNLYLNHTNISVIPMPACSNTTTADLDILMAAQEDTAQRLLYYSLCGSIPAIIVNLVFGSYSDFLGRKLLFFLPVIGDFLRSVLFALIMKYDWNMSFFYLGNAISGLCGSFTTILLACFAYTADITPPEKSRTVAIAILESLMAVASSAGSLAIGYLIATLEYVYPALLVTILLALDLIIVMFVLQESLQKSAAVVINPLVHLKKCFGFFTIYGTGLKRAQYNVCMLTMFFGVIGLIGRTSIETLFQLGFPFCWDSIKIGYYGALSTIVQAVCSVGAIKLLQPCMRDELIAIVGMVSGGASLAIEAYSTTDWMLYVVPVVGLIAFTATPIFRSFMSRMTSPKEQGALFSSIAAMETVCTTVSITLYNTVYEATLQTMKGAVFLMMAGFCVVTILLVIVFMVISRGSRVAYELYIPEHDDLNSSGTVQGGGVQNYDTVTRREKRVT